MRQEKYTDLELVEMISEGRDSRSFRIAEIYIRNISRPFVLNVYNKFPFLVQRNLVEVNEVLNYTIHEVLSAIEKGVYQKKAKITSYAHRIAYNYCNNQRKWWEQRLDSPISADNEYLINNYESSIKSLYNSLDEEELEIKCILENILNLKDYEVAKAIFFDGLSYKECSEKMDVSIGALKVRISRIRSKILANMRNKIYQIFFQG